MFARSVTIISIITIITIITSLLLLKLPTGCLA